MIVPEEVLLRDRRSRHAAPAGPVRDRTGIERFLDELRARRKFARATHHGWAALPSAGEGPRGGDGEAGAGAVILNMPDREGLADHIVVVTRWHGGVHRG
jgi:putative IMPACT (imprinted ancient) family translation regulator